MDDMTGSVTPPPSDPPGQGDAPDAPGDPGPLRAAGGGGSYWDRTRGTAPPDVHARRPDPSHSPRPLQPAHRAPDFVRSTATAATPKARSGLRLAGVALFVCATMVIVGSLTPWVTLSATGNRISFDGNQAGLSTLMGAAVNGWFTFAAGIALLLVGALMVASGERAWRLLAVLIALVTLGLSAYDTARVAYKVSEGVTHPQGLPSSVARILTRTSHGSVGFGLVVLLAAAVGALFVAAKLRSA